TDATDRGNLVVVESDGARRDLGGFTLSDDLLDIGVEAEGCVRLVHGDAPDALSGSGMVTVDGALIEGPTCAEAIDDYEASQRQGLLRVNCGPSGAKANIMRSDETGVASLDCPAEIALEPGVYIVNVVK